MTAYIKLYRLPYIWHFSLSNSQTKNDCSRKSPADLSNFSVLVVKMWFLFLMNALIFSFYLSNKKMAKIKKRSNSNIWESKHLRLILYRLFRWNICAEHYENTLAHAAGLWDSEIYDFFHHFPVSSSLESVIGVWRVCAFLASFLCPAHSLPCL